MRAAAEPGRVQRVGALRRHVADLQRSIDFYCGALGFRVVAARAEEPGARQASLALGAEAIELVQAEASRWRPPAAATDPRFQHAAIVAADMDAAWRRLCTFAPVAISAGASPQHLPAASGGAVAFKFRDPDGHPLELIRFPDGGEDARWQAATGAGPTLGIDHYALVVADVERSIAFFAGLGFRVASRQINRGVEQDRLDGLAAAVVEVVALQPPSSTPHLELLGYRSPERSAATADARERRDGADREAIRLHREAAAGGDERVLVDPDGHRFVAVVSGSPASPDGSSAFPRTTPPRPRTTRTAAPDP